MVNRRYELRSESLCERFLNSDVLHGQTRMRVDEWESESLYESLFSTLMSWSNENKNCTRVDEI